MAGALDAFTSDAFGLVQLTESINLLPFQPMRLGSIGLFEDRFVHKNTVVIERSKNALSLLPTKGRGSDGTKLKEIKRDIYPFNIPHIPHDDTILASEVQDVREFGTENTERAVTGVVNDKLENMRQNHEVTHEWHRIGALKGTILDADGSTTLLNLFTAFGYSQSNATKDFDLGTATTDVRQRCIDVRRYLEKTLGGIPFSGIIGFCGDSFWDKLVSHPQVKEAYDRWQDGRFLRSDPRFMSGGGGNATPFQTDRFEFGGLQFENYRGYIGSQAFIPTADCRFAVTGVRGLFIQHFGPADFIEAVNTRGRRVYAKQERMKFDKGIDLHTQSNPLMMCTRPDTLVRGHTST